MKNYIKALLMLSFLSFGKLILPMEQEKPVVQNTNFTEQSPQLICLSEIAGLPIEIWQIIFESLYFNILSECAADNICDALNYLKEEIFKNYENTHFTCKSFRTINKRFLDLRPTIREFYRNILKQKFLELRDNGLYPKNSNWEPLGNMQTQRLAIFL